MENREATHLIRFGVIGGISVCLDYIVYSSLIDLGLGLLLAKGVSFCVGLVFGFLGNKFWTFRSRREFWSEWGSYLLIYTVTLVINIYTNSIVYNFLTDGRSEISSKAHIIAFLSATSVTTIINYLGIRLITFKKGIDYRNQVSKSD